MTRASISGAGNLEDICPDGGTSFLVMVMAMAMITLRSLAVPGEV